MLFSADHDEPRRILQKFIATEINPFVDEWEKADIFPAHELFKKLGDLGFLGLNKPVAAMQNEASVEEIVNMTSHVVLKAQQAAAHHARTPKRA